jgi:hypothetical protein
VVQVETQELLEPVVLVVLVVQAALEDLVGPEEQVEQLVLVVQVDPVVLVVSIVLVDQAVVVGVAHLVHMVTAKEQTMPVQELVAAEVLAFQVARRVVLFFPMLLPILCTMQILVAPMPVAVVVTGRRARSRVAQVVE